MKKVFILGLILFSLVGKSTICTWTGAVDNDFTNTGNWLLGVVPVPGNGDDLIFGPLGGSNDCVVPSGTNVDVNSISLSAGFSGVLDMGVDDHAITSGLTINAGTFISTTGAIFTGGNFTFSLGGGTFTHNGGTFNISLGASNLFTFSGNIILNSLNISTPSGLATVRTVDFGSNLIANDITITIGGTAPFTKIIDFQGTVHVKTSLNLGNMAHTSNNSTNNGTFIFDGSTATIAGSSSTGAGKAYLPNIVINTTGLYTITGSLNVRGNWTGTQGTLLNSGTSIVNMYSTSGSITGPNAAFNNLVIQAGANISLPSGVTKLSGSLTRTGTLTFQSTTVLGLNGSAGQTTSLGGVSLAGIVCYSNGGSRAVTLSGAITILDSLKIENGVTLTTGGSMTLNASTIKARIAEVGTGASITDNITVQTLIPGGTTGWSLMGVAGVKSQNIKTWDQYPAETNGLPMTCDGCTYGVAALGSDFYSIQGWSESDDDYDTTLVATDPLTPGKGFWVYVGNSGNTDIKLHNTGAPVTGPLDFPVTNSGSAPNSGTPGFNLVANPYACPISWDKTWSFFGSNPADLGATIYVFDPDNGYSVFTADGSGGSGTGGLATGVLAAGQGFYVESLVGSTNVSFGEQGKMDANTGGILKPSGSGIQSFRVKIAGALDHDDGLVRFSSAATPFFDSRYDGRKIFQSPGYVGYPGSYKKYTTISTKDPFDQDYSIQTMPLLTQSLTVPLLARVSTSGTYTISAYDFKDFTSCVSLFDKKDNTYHDLRQADYIFTINDTTSVPRFDLILCKDESLNAVGIAEMNVSNSILISQDQEGAFVRTAFNENTKATISAYNVIGQKLMEDIQVEGKATSTHLNLNLHNQVVLIRVITEKESSTKKMVVH